MPLDPRAVFTPSPNFSSRGGLDVVATVIHYTAGGRASGSIRWLCNPAAKASAHFVIARDGKRTQLVEIEHKAWHVGVGEAPYYDEMTSDPNRFTIGIELANHGLLETVDGEHFTRLGRELRRYRGATPVKATLEYDNGNRITGLWEPYPDLQMDSLQALLKLIADSHGVDAARNLWGHEEIATELGRKKDPGGAFPWERFSRKTPRRTSSKIH